MSASTQTSSVLSTSRAQQGSLKSTVDLARRVLLVAIFLISGPSKITGYSAN